MSVILSSHGHILICVCAPIGVLEKLLTDSYLVDSAGWRQRFFHFQVLHIDAVFGSFDVFFSKYLLSFCQFGDFFSVFNFFLSLIIRGGEIMIHGGKDWGEF